jgi:hypothetical protein
MNTDENPQVPSTNPAAEKVENSTQSELPDAALQDVSGGRQSRTWFPNDAPLPPIKERKEGMLTPRSDS